MIYIHLTSTNRGEGKTTLAVKMLSENPTWWLRVRTPHQRKYIVDHFGLAPSQAARIVTEQDSDDRLMGLDVDAMILDG